jgi:prepilin-type N-terminal cleavage/methylation domain-containing protein
MGICANIRKGDKMRTPFKSVKGFSLIEIMVVIIIIGVLAVIAVPLYRSYVNGAIAEEGKSLVNAVAAAEMNYFSQNNKCLGVEPPSSGGQAGTAQDPLGINATQNMYFTTYEALTTANPSSNDFRIDTTYTSGSLVIDVTLNHPNGGPSVTWVTGT